MVDLNRSTYRCKGMGDEQAGLRMRLRELAGLRVSYGYRRLHVLLEREGWRVNHKRVYRLYREEGLLLRTKRPRRRVSCKGRGERTTAGSPKRVGRWTLWPMSCTTGVGCER